VNRSARYESRLPSRTTVSAAWPASQPQTPSTTDMATSQTVKCSETIPFLLVDGFLGVIEIGLDPGCPRNRLSLGSSERVSSILPTTNPINFPCSCPAAM